MSVGLGSCCRGLGIPALTQAALAFRAAIRAAVGIRADFALKVVE